MQSRKWSVYVTKNDRCILCGDLLLMLDFLKEGSAVYGRKQCIKVYLTPLCATEQHGIFIFSSKFEKEGGKKVVGVGLVTCFSFLFIVCVRNKLLEFMLE